MYSRFVYYNLVHRQVSQLDSTLCREEFSELSTMHFYVSESKFVFVPASVRIPTY